MLRTLGAGVAGATVGFGAALFGEVSPILFASAGAMTAVTFPMAPRLPTLLASGAAAFGLVQITEAWSASALLFVALLAIGELTRTSDRPESAEAAKWSPANFWCAAVALFFVVVAHRDADPRLTSSAVLALAIPPAIVAARLSNVMPFVVVAVVGAALGIFAPSAPLVLGYAVAATLPLLTWCLAHVVRIRRQRLREVGLAGSLSGVLAGDLATCAAAGYTPRGSGTVGALTALPFAWWFASFELVPRLAIVGAITLVSIVVAYRYCAGSSDDLDPSEVVLDEFIGVLIPLALVPWSWPWVVASFVAFRFFDIAKPGPIGWMDKNIKSPAGIMLDDVVAGIFAAVLMVGARQVLG